MASFLHSRSPVFGLPNSLGARWSPVPAAAVRATKLTVRAAGRAGSWLPGTELPKETGLPGDFGFDPLKLGENSESLKWFAQAELQNGRWAMLGVFGILFHALIGKAGLGGPAATTTTWFDAGKFNYGVDNRTLLAIEFFLFAWVEIRRYQDMQKPGSTNQDPIFTNNSLPSGNEPGYPGGIFDPLGFSKGNIEELKLKEVKNGRLAMLAFLGFVCQARTTGKSPLDNLFDHLADPFGVNVFTKGLGRGGELPAVFLEVPMDDRGDMLETIQVLPYMLDATPRRRLSSYFLPNRSWGSFGRRRHSVLPVPDMPSYESMLQLDENNPKRGVKLVVLNRLPQVCPTGQEASEGCLICLESYPEGNAAKRLPCSHIFCHGCIRTWLTNHRSCPVCRFEFPDKETHLIIPK